MLKEAKCLSIRKAILAKTVIENEHIRKETNVLNKDMWKLKNNLWYKSEDFFIIPEEKNTGLKSSFMAINEEH